MSTTEQSFSTSRAVTGQKTQALVHVYPQWEPIEDDPSGEPQLVWRGHMRIVHAQRARKLRRRGVPLLDLRAHTSKGYIGRASYAWFVEEPRIDKSVQGSLNDVIPTENKL